MNDIVTGMGVLKRSCYNLFGSVPKGRTDFISIIE